MKKYVLIGSFLLILAGFAFWSNSVSSEASKAFPTKKIEQVEITTKEWDVQIVHSNKPAIKVVADGLGKTNAVKAKVTNGVLQVDQKKSEGGLFGGFSFKNNKKIKIMVPSSYSKSLNIVTQSGDVEVNEISLTNISAGSINGDIYLQKVDTKDCQKTSFSTEKGDIDLSFKTEPTNLKLNPSSREIDNEKGITKFGKGENQLDLKCPKGTLTIF